MKPRPTAKVPLDEQIEAIPHFQITITKRDIIQLMEREEEANARLVEQVNNGEQEMMQRDESSAAQQKL